GHRSDAVDRDDGGGGERDRRAVETLAGAELRRPGRDCLRLGADDRRRRRIRAPALPLHRPDRPAPGAVSRTALAYRLLADSRVVGGAGLKPIRRWLIGGFVLMAQLAGPACRP